MIQSGSFLNVIDNSGAKKLLCIKILNGGYKQRYAKIGCVILVSVKKIKFSKNIKVKKGELHKALIIKTNSFSFSKKVNYKKYFKNAAILLNKKNRLLGTRIFDKVPKEFKYSKYLKILTLSAGISI
jgi:large subunit ribosomal protein L14